MIHPDYVIGAVSLLIIAVLLPIRIRQTREESEQIAKPLPPPKMSPEKFAELITLLCEHEAQHALYEAGHPFDGTPYPLQPSRYIPAPPKHDAPYQITKVILPIETDQQKWN
jgi:hypothetical protein